VNVKDHLKTRNNGAKSTGTKAPKVLNPEKVFHSQIPDWEIRNCGGAGDCAFRSVAYSIAEDQEKPLNIEALVREPCKLRHYTIGHILKNRSDFERHWAHDPDEPDCMRAYQPVPESFADYMMLASMQGFYDALAAHFYKKCLVFSFLSE